MVVQGWGAERASLMMKEKFFGASRGRLQRLCQVVASRPTKEANPERCRGRVPQLQTEQDPLGKERAK
jgi:hypothetical protein